MAKVHLTVRVQPEAKAFYAKFHKDGAGAALDQIAKEKGVKFAADSAEKKPAAPKVAKAKPAKKAVAPKPAKAGIAVTKDNAAKIVAGVAAKAVGVKTTLGTLKVSPDRANRQPILRPGQLAKKR